MSIINSSLSKAVGFTSRTVAWPSNIEEIDGATDLQLLTWYRFLSCPEIPEKVELMNRIVERVQESR